MKHQIGRRHFLQVGVLGLTGAAISPVAHSTAQARAAESGDRIKKAVGWEMIREELSAEDKFRLVKDVGFEGVEINSQLLRPGSPEPREIARASEKIGIPVHGVSGASNTDLKAILEEAAIYGATSVLHVVRADPNGSYLDNYRRSQELLREAAPYAEKHRIPILIENVWATFLIEPLTMARYIDELNSPFVQAYFDVGNCMRWGLPQQWIEVLGKRIGKIHVKEYSLKTAMSQGMGKGFDFPMGQGDIQWNRVREELDKIGFRGWATAEVRGGDRQRLAEISAEMSKILAL
ncbi:MAG TPA: TIM barrel protein [Candidatus Anammoximicrobium sp.]|nr:TIM barrel protein [Candidatus Anammoximicrobium sp.]